jgi:uncharacterized membrane protein required for colicin V production
LSVNVYDILFVALPVALFLLGYVRGAWRELLSLAGVSAGAILGARYHHALATQIISVFADRDFASLLAFIAFLLAGYFVGGFLGGLADHQTRTRAASSGERLLAALFGGLKGVVLDLSIYWIVLSYIPTFQAELRHSRVADSVGELLKLLAKHSPV